jgi:hypothetical protein
MPVEQQTRNPGQPGNNQNPAHNTAEGTGQQWSQEKLNLHAQGLCVWCRDPNPDLRKMGCFNCLQNIDRRVKGFMAKFRE